MSATHKSALAYIQFNYPTLESATCRESTDKAIEALEKQIPKELSTVIKEANGREFKFYYCSSCYVNIESKYKYCLNCGQKLDWSDLSERD